MTTDAHEAFVGTSERGSGVLLAAAAFASATGLVLSGVGALVGGSPAAYGALSGTLVAVVVFGLGTLAVDRVAGLVPTASLLVALSTYLLQLVTVWALLSLVERSGLTNATVDRVWLGGTLILGALAWISAQIVAYSRRRIPAFDLPDHGVGAAPRVGSDAGE